jgi:hypothetical protein
MPPFVNMDHQPLGRVLAAAVPALLYGGTTVGIVPAESQESSRPVAPNIPCCAPVTLICWDRERLLDGAACTVTAPVPRFPDRCLPER